MRDWEARAQLRVLQYQMKDHLAMHRGGRAQDREEHEAKVDDRARRTTWRISAIGIGIAVATSGAAVAIVELATGHLH